MEINRPLLPTLFVIFLLVLSLFSSCTLSDPVTIGFSGTLTGKFAEAGISGRSGVLLAVEQVNRKGGIRGRKVKLLVHDDQNDPVRALRSDKEMIDRGAVAVIGHMSSTMSLAVLPLFNREKVLLISPAAGTRSLDDRDDYFVRVDCSSTEEVNVLTGFITGHQQISSIAFLYDISNNCYTSNYLKHCSAVLAEHNVVTKKVIAYDSRQEFSYYDLAEAVLASKADGLFILADPQDSALFCQQVRKIGSTVPLYLSSWAQGKSFLIYGGEAVEGVVLAHTYIPSEEGCHYDNFRTDFIERFNREPDFTALYAYDAAHILCEILKDGDDPVRLKERLIRISRFKGADGEFTINRFGDAQRNVRLITVRKGMFRELAE